MLLKGLHAKIDLLTQGIEQHSSQAYGRSTSQCECGTHLQHRLIHIWMQVAHVQGPDLLCFADGCHVVGSCYLHKEAQIRLYGCFAGC